MIDVTDLPINQLQKSYTYSKYVEECGRCLRCKEMTSLLDPCCGAPVAWEGGSMSYEELWDQIEEELKTNSETD